DAHPDRWASNEARSSSSRSRWWYASRFAHGLSMDRPLRLRGRRQNPPERLAKGRSGAVKMDPGRAAGTAEDLSDLLGRQVGIEGQQHRLALLLGQRGDRLERREMGLG